MQGYHTSDSYLRIPYSNFSAIVVIACRTIYDRSHRSRQYNIHSPIDYAASSSFSKPPNLPSNIEYREARWERERERLNAREKNP